MGDFTKDVAITLAQEGGATITDNKNDPGGLTKYGISQKRYPHEDIKALTEDRAELLYRRDYWTPIGGDQLPEPLALNAFDAAVNLGVPVAKRLLQGPATSVSADVDDFLWARVREYAEICRKNPKLLTFLPGWIIRTCNLRKASAA